MRSAPAFIALMICASGTSLAETRSLPNLTKEGLSGTWEAIVQDDSMAHGIYRMEFHKDGSAELIQVFGTADGGREQFLGKLTSCQLKDGNVSARFVLMPGHMNYYDWLEVQGTAVGEGDMGAITGKIHKHRTGTVLDDWSEPVLFKKGSWLAYLLNASKRAEELIRKPMPVR
jgi:hypothetical protein